MLKLVLTTAAFCAVAICHIWMYCAAFLQAQSILLRLENEKSPKIKVHITDKKHLQYGSSSVFTSHNLHGRWRPVGLQGCLDAGWFLLRRESSVQ